MTDHTAWNADHDALLAIQDVMDGTAWDADTLETIATILIKAGYSIRDLDNNDR